MAGHWYFTTTRGKRASGSYEDIAELAEDFELTASEQAILKLMDSIELDNGNVLSLEYCECPITEYCGGMVLIDGTGGVHNGDV